MAKAKQIEPEITEPEIWRDRIAVLRAGLKQGRQGSKRAAEIELKKLNRNIATINRRRHLAAERATDLKATAEIIADEARRCARELHDISTAEAKLAAVAEAEAAKATEIKALINAYKAPDMPDDNQPTPEHVARPARTDPLDALEQLWQRNPRDGISHEQALAGYKIRAVSEAISRAGQAKTSRMEGGGGGGGTWREGDVPDHIVDVYHGVYLPWLGQIGVRSDEGYVVEKIAVRGLRLRVVARHKHVSDDTALKMLRVGLDKFNELWRSTKSKVEAVHQLPPVEVAP